MSPIEYVEETVEEKAFRKWNAKTSAALVVAVGIILAWCSVYLAPMMAAYEENVRAVTLNLHVESEYTPAASFVMGATGDNIHISYPEWEFPAGYEIHRAWVAITRYNTNGTILMSMPFGLSGEPLGEDMVRTYKLPLSRFPGGSYNGELRYDVEITYMVMHESGALWRYAKVKPRSIQNIETP